MTRSSTPPPPARQVADATFLADEFDIPEPAAAELVSEDEGEAAGVAAAANRARRKRDPLQDVPVPRDPPEQHTVDTDEQRLKPVLHQPNDRVGGG